MLRKLNRIAQSTAEYAIIIAIVVGAVIAMQVYVKRGLQARIKDAVSRTAQDPALVGGTVGTEGNPFTGIQYEPNYVDSDMSANRFANTTEKFGAGGNKQIRTNETSNRTGEQITVAPTARP